MWAVSRQPAMSRISRPSSPMPWLLWGAQLQAQVCEEILSPCATPVGPTAASGWATPEELHLILKCPACCRSQCGERLHQLREEVCICGVQNR